MQTIRDDSVLRNLQAQEIVKIVNAFNMAMDNQNQQVVVDSARYLLTGLVNNAVGHGRLTDYELLNIFDLFMVHSFLTDAANSGPGMITSTIIKVYGIRPYATNDLLLLHMELI
jgi:hypothetical protein